VPGQITNQHAGLAILGDLRSHASERSSGLHSIEDLRTSAVDCPRESSAHVGPEETMGSDLWLDLAAYFTTLGGPGAWCFDFPVAWFAIMLRPEGTWEFCALWILGRMVNGTAFQWSAENAVRRRGGRGERATRNR
jgi:hypothetical protein